MFALILKEKSRVQDKRSCWGYERGNQTNLVESLVGDSHRLLDGRRVKREQHALVLKPNGLHKQRFGAVREKNINFNLT